MEQVFIQKNSLVKIYFKNGTVVEGIVLIWGDKKGLLQSPDCQNRMIIYNPIENVMMVKLLYPKIKKNKPETDEVTTNEPIKYNVVKNVLKENFVSDLNQPKHEVAESFQERTKKIVNYRLLQASQERKKIAESMMQPSSSNTSLDFSKQPPKVETTYYGSPNFTKRGSFLNSRKKNS